MKPYPNAARLNLVCFAALAAVAIFPLGGCGAKPSKAAPVPAAPLHYRLTLTRFAGTAINDKGEMCGAVQSGKKNKYSQQPDMETTHLAVWRNGRVHDLGTLAGADWCGPTAINNLGEVVGTVGPYAMGPGDTSPDSIRRFFWSRGKMHDLGPDGEAAALNNLGQVVGWKTWPDGQHGFVYQGGTTREIENPLGPGVSAVVAINDRGQMVQVAFDSRGPNAKVHAFLLNGNAVTELNPPPGYALSFYSRPVLTGAGRVIFQDYTVVGTLPRFPHIDLVATNDQGTSVGSASKDGDLPPHLKFRAVVWQSGSLYDLNDLVPRHTGVLEWAISLNSRGQIIASGEDAHGQFQGFLLTPITK